MLKSYNSLSRIYPGKFVNTFCHSSTLSLKNSHHSFLQDVRGSGEGSIHSRKICNTIEISISNPNKKNAISGKMMYDFAALIDEIEEVHINDPGVLGITLKGTGDVFCAGADFDLIHSVINTPEKGKYMCAFMTDALHRLQNCGLISFALVSGPAIGGGAEIAISTDFRVMTTSSYLRFVHAKMGISPGWGGGYRLVSLIGRSPALQALGTCSIISPTAATSLGLSVDTVLDEMEGMAVIQNLLKRYSDQNYPNAIKAMKRLVVGATSLPFEKAVEQEQQILGGLWAGIDHREALAKYKIR